MRIPTCVREQLARAVICAAPRLRQQRSSLWTVLAAEVQLLEERALLSGSVMHPFTMPDLVQNGAGGLQPLTTSGPTGYTPAQIRHAYGFDQISFNGVAGDGSGTTIAIVDAYDDPTIANDLHQFDLAYGLPDPPKFTKVNQNGSTSSLPVADSGWATEIALDVEWAHAIAPGANILLLEARSDSDSDLMTAVNTARNTSGVVVVSMSWGGSEDPTEVFDDSTFKTPNGHSGVTFVASAGDDGAPASYPSASPNVLSVGGTTLNLSASGNILSESAWSGSGGGISSVESQPTYQKGVVTQSSTFRATPDVSYDSDPNTGFGVYDSYNNGTSRPWGQWGGTSDAAPQWAALIAIADQGRIRAGKGTLDGPTQTLPMLYSLSASDFHDITSGSSTGSPSYSAGPGYDLATGRGTPYANRMVSDLVGVPTGPTLTSIATLGTAYAQTPFGITYSTLLGASDAADTNGQPIQFRINSIQNGTLSIVHNNVTSSVLASPTSGTLFGAGDTLIWTGPAGLSGNISGFTVTAFDGTTNSPTAVSVNINVSNLGTQFSLSGPWVVVNSAGTTLGLGSITQTGANLTFVNATGLSSSGAYSSQVQITSSNLNGSGAVAGTVDVTNADQGRIVWSDGSTWLRVSLGGQYAVSTPGSGTVTLGSVTQSGTSLTFATGSSSFSGTVAGLSQLTLAGIASGATYGDGKITLTGSGQVWRKLDLPPDYTNPGGAATHVIQNWTTGVVFVDKFGNTSPGYWISPTQLYATAWNETATTGTGTLVWNDGTVWYENLVLSGAASTGAGTISAKPSQLAVYDYVNGAGKAVHVVLNGTSSVVFVDGLGHFALGTWLNSTQALTADYPGDTATFIGNSVYWADGSVWTQVGSSSAPLTVSNYTNAIGAPVFTVQNGTNALVFVDGLGHISVGGFLNSIQAVSTAYPGDKATFLGGNVSWDDGSTWTGSANRPIVMSFTDAGGSVSHFEILSSGTLTGLDGALFGATGTRLNGTITWSNGIVWNRFDYNGLNALFQMAAGYP